MWPPHRLGGRGERAPRIKYSLEDDIERIPYWPFSFYILKSGAKAKRAHAAAEASADPRSGWSLAPAKWIQIGSDDIAQLQTLIYDAYWLCPSLWVSYICLQLVSALIPAATVHFQGQLFGIVQSAVERREADTNTLLVAVAGNAGCTLLTRFLSTLHYDAEIFKHLDRIFGDRVIAAKAHLDLPTCTDPVTLAKLSQTSGGPRTPFNLINTIIGFATTAVQLVTQVWMLTILLRKQPESAWLVMGSFASPLARYIRQHITDPSYACSYVHGFGRRRTLAGLMEPHRGDEIRKEIVVNNMADFLAESYKQSSAFSVSVSPQQVWSRYRGTTYSVMAMSILQDVAAEAPRIAFAWNALHTPSHIPVSLATLQLVQTQARMFADLVQRLMSNSESLKSQITKVKELYDLDQLPNLVKDGYKDFKPGGQGVSVEFDSVSFRYPGQDALAISNVSFKLPAGSLCVLVGANGQGKSSILKLVTRLHDATEGTIRVQDEPIQNFLLNDLRKATSVLFQDFATFPFSMEENIRLGDASTALLPLDSVQQSRIDRAAELGGAAEFIAKLPKGMKTDFREHAEMPSVTQGADGRDILFAVMEADKQARKNQATSLSGGQAQRLALSRTFMKPQDEVSLLIYDEPSASLDPQAEYDLFQRLQSLRGTKTMIFSTHRFGYLTKHADVILYMKDSTIAESGTHAELMAQGGGYAHLFRLQANAFAE